jgi:hypothetical protein
MTFLIGIIFGAIVGAGTMRWFSAKEIIELQDLVERLKKSRRVALRRVR